MKSDLLWIVKRRGVYHIVNIICTSNWSNENDFYKYYLSDFVNFDGVEITINPNKEQQPALFIVGKRKTPCIKLSN